MEAPGAAFVSDPGNAISKIEVKAIESYINLVGIVAKVA